MRIKSFLVIVSCLLAAICYADQSVSVTDNTGAVITLDKPAERIISTVPSNTEILYALGLKDRVVALTKYCAKTCDTKGKIIIGGWTDPDLEKMRDAKPDLIFAFGGLQKRQLEGLRKIAPAYCFEPVTVDATLRTILDIGILTGCETKARTIVAEQKRKLDDIRAKISAVPPEKRLSAARVFGTNMDVITAGRKCFLSDVIRQAGGKNVFDYADENYFHVTFDRLAGLDPDALIVHGEETDAARKIEAFKNSPEFGKLKAVKNGRVFVHSCDYICHPNAVVADTVEMVARDLYPEIFKGDIPERIISLGPAMTEELYILGVDDRLIGCTVYCQKPPETKDKTKVGTAIEVNLEKVVAMKPDLVLATSLTNMEARTKLKQLGIKVVDFPAARNFDQVCEHFLTLAKIVGKEKEAQNILSAVRSRIGLIKERSSKSSKPRVFIQIGATPLVTVTKDSFVNDFIELAGGINIAKDLPSDRYSREMVVKANPDVFIIVTMGIKGDKEKEAWQKYNQLSAVKNNKIYIMEDNLLCSPTPVSFVETTEKIENILHPEDKNNG